MNLRPSGYEPDELPDCSTPQQRARILWARSAHYKAVTGIVLSDAAQGRTRAHNSMSALGKIPSNSTATPFKLVNARIVPPA